MLQFYKNVADIVEHFSRLLKHCVSIPLWLNWSLKTKLQCTWFAKFKSGEIFLFQIRGIEVARKKVVIRQHFFFCFLPLHCSSTAPGLQFGCFRFTIFWLHFLLLFFSFHCYFSMASNLVMMQPYCGGKSTKCQMFFTPWWSLSWLGQEIMVFQLLGCLWLHFDSFSVNQSRLARTCFRTVIIVQ